MVMQRSLNIKCIQDDEFITNFACASSKNPKHLKYEMKLSNIDCILKMEIISGSRVVMASSELSERSQTIHIYWNFFP